MDFNSLLFIGFFAAVALVNYLLPRIARPYFLLVASYAFYLYKPANAQLVGLLVLATLVTWAAALAMDKLQAKAARICLLWVSILVCLGSLVLFKYWGFLDEAFVSLIGLFGGEADVTAFDFAAPLGLSYFTFQSMGYAIDVYRRKVKAARNPFKYALFVSFFPCIFTGPIERYGHLAPQFDKPRRFDYERCAGGAFRMLWGYVKKMVIADTLGIFVAAALGSMDTLRGPVLVLACLLFSTQIYMDFSGCCDIAIGGARILGYDLLENFNNPFLAKDFTGLWARWHMSLTGWFRDYIYIPLGGSRKGLVRTCLNSMLVFLVSGLWHGAAWGYLGWGFACGLIAVLARLLAAPKKALAAHAPLRHTPVLQHVVHSAFVYLLFTAAIVFFMGALYGVDPMALYHSFAAGWPETFAAGWDAFGTSLAELGLKGQLPAMLACGIPLVYAVEAAGNVSEWIRRQCWAVRWILYYSSGAAILFFGAFGQSIFIYQQY